MECGLLGVAVDPAFTTNHFVFLYCSFNKSGACNSATVYRVARFMMTKNSLSGEAILIDNIPSSAGNHNGGDLQFGRDGFLYVSVGHLVRAGVGDTVWGTSSDTPLTSPS